VVPVHHWPEVAAVAARVRGEVIRVDEDAIPLDAGSTPPAFTALPPATAACAASDRPDMDYAFPKCSGGQPDPSRAHTGEGEADGSGGDPRALHRARRPSSP
jgi:hypothetical protein